MRIISRFHDYYDTAMRHGQDRSLVFVRENQCWEPHGKSTPPAALGPFLERAGHLPMSTSKRQPMPGVWEFNVHYGLIWFAGRVYPLAQVTTRKDSLALDLVRFVYDYPTLLALAADHEVELGGKSRRHVFWSTPPMERKDFFEQDPEVLLPAAYETGIAIASSFNSTVELNPRLADFEFVRRLDPWQAYQELSMFLGNLAAPDRVPVVVADKDRVQQHGFDEWSFRRLPTKPHARR